MERGLRGATTSYLLAMVHHAIRARLEAALRPVNVTPLQFTILEVLAAHDDVTSADLSRRFYVTPQSMGEIVAHLVRRGLARREPLATDRRVFMIQATEAGRALLVEGEAALAVIESEVFIALNAAELGALRGVLATLVQPLRRAPAALSAS